MQSERIVEASFEVVSEFPLNPPENLSISKFDIINRGATKTATRAILKLK